MTIPAGFYVMSFPIWHPLLLILSLLNLYWVIRCLLQVLRVDELTAVRKLIWIAVIYNLPIVGPLAWHLSKSNPKRLRFRSKS